MSDGAIRTMEHGGTGRGKRRKTGPLSNREREVFELLAEGLSGAQIADRLVLSPETVRTHIRNAMAKLGASTRSQAVVVALERREISPPAAAPAPERELPEDVPAMTAAQVQPTAPGERTETLELVVDGLMNLFDVDAGWAYPTDDDGLTLRRGVEHTSDDFHTDCRR